MASWLYNTLIGSGPVQSEGKIRLPADLPPSYDPSTAPPKPAQRGPRPPLDLPALNLLRGKRVILASASPRRKQLLAQVC